MKPIAILLLCTIIYSCTKSENCPLKFKIPIQVFPIKTEYHVGDTLTFVSKFHKDVEGYNSSDQALGKFDMSGFSWEPTAGVYKIDTISAGSDVITTTTFIPDSAYDFNLSNYSNNSSLLSGEFNLQSDTFTLVYKLILSKPGLFVSEFGSWVTGSISPQYFPGACKNEQLEVSGRMNEGDNNNIDLLNESPDPHWNTWVLEKPEDRFYDMGSYAFRVLE